VPAQTGTPHRPSRRGARPGAGVLTVATRPAAAALRTVVTDGGGRADMRRASTRRSGGKSQSAGISLSRTRTAVLCRRRVPILTVGSHVQPRQRGSHDGVGRAARKAMARVSDNGPLSLLRTVLNLQMGEGDRLALHQVLACRLEQWHRYPPITAAADSRSAGVGQGQAARSHGPSAGGHGVDWVLPVRARVRSDLNSGREARVVSPSQRGSAHA
jgi:hypothetical protein